MPVVEAVRALGGRVSIDTTKPGVARAALAAGAGFVNDVSGGQVQELFEIAAEQGAHYVLMHNRGRGQVTSPNTDYANVVQDVVAELERSVAEAGGHGLERDRIIVDPGIGFAKTVEQNALLLSALDSFVATGHRVLVGASRKSFIATLAPNADGSSPGPLDRIGGTIATTCLAAQAGCYAVRVHDVVASRQAIMLTEAIAKRGR